MEVTFACKVVIPYKSYIFVENQIKIDWKIQLNLRNAFGDSDPIPVVTNPDGNVAVLRNSLPQEIFLTNTFRF